jgi:hypothetical protein
MNFHTFELFNIARAAVLRAREDSVRPNAMPTDALVAIVMSAAAGETFINELSASLLMYDTGAGLTTRRIRRENLTWRSKPARLPRPAQTAVGQIAFSQKVIYVIDFIHFLWRREWDSKWLNSCSSPAGRVSIRHSYTHRNMASLSGSL